MSAIFSIPTGVLVAELRRRGVLGDEFENEDAPPLGLGEIVMRLRGGQMRECLFLIGRALTQHPGAYDLHDLDAAAERYFKA